jgi:hypothetical protein
MSMRKDWFEDMNYRRKEVAVANNDKVYSSKDRTRDVTVKFDCGNSDAIRQLRMLLYVPELMTNLLSVNQDDLKGIN